MGQDVGFKTFGRKMDEKVEEPKAEPPKVEEKKEEDIKLEALLKAQETIKKIEEVTKALEEKTKAMDKAAAEALLAGKGIVEQEKELSPREMAKQVLEGKYKGKLFGELK